MASIMKTGQEVIAGLIISIQMLQQALDKELLTLLDFHSKMQSHIR